MRIQTERAILRSQKAEALNEIADFTNYLSSDKFQGSDNDYIRTWEVERILRQVRDILAQLPEDVEEN